MAEITKDMIGEIKIFKTVKGATQIIVVKNHWINPNEEKKIRITEKNIDLLNKLQNEKKIEEVKEKKKEYRERNTKSEALNKTKKDKETKENKAKHDISAMVKIENKSKEDKE